MSKQLRVLVIGAHPADIFDQSAGTMAHHTKRGDWVGCVVLTHGARIHDKVVSDEMFKRERVPEADELLKLMAERSDVKAKEVVKACKLIGVEDVYFFGADDAVLLVDEPTIRRLARMIRALRPDIVLTHFPKEDGGVGSPHSITGEIVMHALFLAAGVDPGDPNPPHRAAAVFYFGAGAASIRSSVWNSEGGYYNDVFIDITDVIEKKLACLDAIMSQGYAGAYARKRVETNDGAFGNHARVAYAEGFISARAQLHYYLPLSEETLKSSRLSDHDIIRRMSYRAQFPPLATDAEEQAPQNPAEPRRQETATV